MEKGLVYNGNVMRTLLFKMQDHPGKHIMRLAYAEINPERGGSTHYHPISEEIYYILEGEAELTLDGKKIFLSKEMTASVPPKTIHHMRALGNVTLKYIAFHVCDGDYFGEIQHLDPSEKVDCG